VDQRVQDAFNSQMVFHGRGEPLLVWASDGRAFYFVGNSGGLQNIWKVDVDRQSLRLTGGPYRVTSMSEDNEGVSIARDGTRLVFGAAHRKYRLAVYDLDPAGRRIVGEPLLVTDPELHALMPDVSTDGSRLLVHVRRPGSGTGLSEIREYDLRGSTPRTLKTTNGKAGETRSRLRWEPHDRTIVYGYSRRVVDQPGGEPRQVGSLMLLDPVTKREEQLTTPTPRNAGFAAYGWTPDGRFVIAERDRQRGSAIVLLPVSAAPAAERQLKVVTENADYLMWNTNMPSGDDRWICFNATDANVPGGGSRLGVVNLSGKGWDLLTGPDVWADKPKWSADGRLIYYVAREGGRATLWALEFDPDKGVAVGQPFPLSGRFSGPAEQIPADMGLVELGVAPRKIAVPVVKPTGSIWMLENFDK
jgi:Tol biopolymer transport system component